ncbi:hypothetical protein Q1695_003245 [Nippostrongylus brasiliensis]|nr:hypothetical protein Q1695_003245 [Nippostrongylus brasiliensis]
MCSDDLVDLWLPTWEMKVMCCTPPNSTAAVIVAAFLFCVSDGQTTAVQRDGSSFPMPPLPSPTPHHSTRRLHDCCIDSQHGHQPCSENEVTKSSAPRHAPVRRPVFVVSRFPAPVVNHLQVFPAATPLPFPAIHEYSISTPTSPNLEFRTCMAQ